MALRYWESDPYGVFTEPAQIVESCDCYLIDEGFAWPQCSSSTTQPTCRGLRSIFGCCMGTIQKSATYKISGAVERRAVPIRELVEYKRAAKTEATKEKSLASFSARSLCYFVTFSPDRATPTNDLRPTETAAVSVFCFHRRSFQLDYGARAQRIGLRLRCIRTWRNRRPRALTFKPIQR